MFKIIDKPEFTHTVAVMVPTDGGHREDTLKARFRVVDGDAHELNTAEGTIAFLTDAVVSLDDIADVDGKPVPYSDAVRDQVLRLPYVRLALIRTYMTALTKARVGN